MKRVKEFITVFAAAILIPGIVFTSADAQTHSTTAVMTVTAEVISGSTIQVGQQEQITELPIQETKGSRVNEFTLTIPAGAEYSAHITDQTGTETSTSQLFLDKTEESLALGWDQVAFSYLNGNGESVGTEVGRNQTRTATVEFH